MAEKKPAKKTAPKSTRSTSKKTAARVTRAKPDAESNQSSASHLITARIVQLGDWRGEVLAHVRKLIQQADPEVVEEWKWENPVWSHDGIICTGESYKQAVKLTFPKGASLEDPDSLFNSSLEGAVRRALDIRKDDELNEAAFKKLIRSAVALNRSQKKK